MKNPDFRFPFWTLNRNGRKKTWIDRWHARRVALTMWRAGANTYQCGGHEGRKGSYHLIDVDKYTLIHCILRQAGYYCCIAEIMERCGVGHFEKEEDGTVRVIHEERIP